MRPLFVPPLSASFPPFPEASSRPAGGLRNPGVGLEPDPGHGQDLPESCLFARGHQDLPGFASGHNDLNPGQVLQDLLPSGILESPAHGAGERFSRLPDPSLEKGEHQTGQKHHIPQRLDPFPVLQKKPVDEGQILHEGKPSLAGRLFLVLPQEFPRRNLFPGKSCDQGEGGASLPLRLHLLKLPLSRTGRDDIDRFGLSLLPLFGSSCAVSTKMALFWVAPVRLTGTPDEAEPVSDDAPS